MRLTAARIRNFRSIRDTGWFEIENDKTILVGPNEAGKSALLKALQQIKPPADAPRFDPLRDYPRSQYNDISTGAVKPSNVVVAEAKFKLEEDDLQLLPEEFHQAVYCYSRKIDNSGTHGFENAPEVATYGKIKNDLLRLAAHADSRVPTPTDGQEAPQSHAAKLKAIVANWIDSTLIGEANGELLTKWADEVTPLVDETNAAETDRLAKIQNLAGYAARRQAALKAIERRVPVFVLFSNYFRVQPLMHLEHLATRIEQKLLDDSQYDYGNSCLLKLLGFTARELSSLGKAEEPSQGDVDGLKAYRDQLDKRKYQLNAASVRLTGEIRSVWVPDSSRAEADKLRIEADGQYLKVVVEDDLGVEIELNQRSEGFQWLVSFFTVFFAESADQHANAVLLLDEPGLSLHALKQKEFRTTVSRLAAKNQTLYTTHSPFLVGPNELDLVRVVELPDRTIGTKVHTTITASDPAALLPLQEALGYDLAQSLFTQQRNLVLEGLTDLWYLEGTADLLRASNIADLNDKIALIPANTASRVVYFATILFAQKFKVAALLDSDGAGEQAAKQDELVSILGNKKILRTKDAYSGAVPKSEIEDLLRETLVAVAKVELGWDVSLKAQAQPARPIVDIFAAEIADFSKYKLAKAYVRWTRAHDATDLTPPEIDAWKKLITLINAALK